MGLFSKALDKLKRLLLGSKPEPKRCLVCVGVNNNPRIATYAAYLEYGWTQTVTVPQVGWLNHHGASGIRPGSKLVMLPRPTFATTVRKNTPKWQKIARNAMKRQMPRYQPDDILTLLGTVATDDIKTQIATAEGMPRRKPLTLAIYAAMASGHDVAGLNNTTTDKPLVHTGAFLGSISWEIREE